MRPLTIEELRELAPGFVIGTLSLDEQHSFDEAMASGLFAAELNLEIAAHRAAAEFLAMSHEVAPPPALKARVMARIAAERKDPAHGAMPDTAPNPATPSAPLVAPVASPVASRTATLTASRTVSRTEPGPGRAGWWSAGALGIALAASLVFALDLREETRTLRRDLSQQVAELTGTKTRLAERERTLSTLLGGGADVTLVRLAPSQPRGPGMQVFWNVREGRAIVTASGLSPITRDRAYALWMIRDGKPVPLALFSPDSSGRAVVSDIAVPTDLQGVAAFAVTEEPAAGSPQPTMTPFLVGAVPKS